MKVLLSAFECMPGYGSEIGNAWHWASALSDLGHDVTVLTLPSSRESILGADRHDIEFHFLDLPRSPLRHMSRRFGLYDNYLRWQDSALEYVSAQSRSYDVMHHVTWGSLRLGSMLWRLPMPLVYGPIGGGQVAPSDYWRYFGRAWPAERLRTMSAGSLLGINSRARETFRNSSVTLVTNSATAKASARLGARDVRFMLADGLPAEWFAIPPRRPASTPVVLWVGRMLPIKAPMLAVRAFAELRRSMSARLVMAGDGPLRAQVSKAIEKLRLADDVELLGWVSWHEIRDLYDSASVLLFTSLRDSFGAQFLEALGRGLPAVALDHQGIGDVDVGPAAIKVALPTRPQDLPGHLATAMRTILTDSDWESRSAAGRTWATQWAWPAKAAAATQIYQELVSCRS